jgi:hypothetical protein
LRLKQTEIGFTATAQAIWSDMRGAYQSWVQWEAINDRFAGAAGKELGRKLEMSGLDQSIGATRMALARDAMLRAYRLSEPVVEASTARRVSLCEAARDLRQPGFYARLTSTAWAEEHAVDLEDFNTAAARTGSRLKDFAALVVPDWLIEKPDDNELAQLRTILRSSRNEMVHGIKPVESDLPTIDQIRRLMDLTLQLAADLACVSGGQLIDVQGGEATLLETFITNTKDQAQGFWQLALVHEPTGN